MKLIVVINTDLGWDNIVGIFDASTVDMAEIEARFNNPAEIIIDWRKLDKLEEYD